MIRNAGSNRVAKAKAHLPVVNVVCLADRRKTGGHTKSSRVMIARLVDASKRLITLNRDGGCLRR